MSVDGISESGISTKLMDRSQGSGILVKGEEECGHRSLAVGVRGLSVNLCMRE